MEDRKINENYFEEDPVNRGIVDSPREIKISGKINRVYVEGNDLCQKFTFDRRQHSVSKENSKKKSKRYIIVPIQDENSVVQFMKVPIYTLNKKPKAKHIGLISCEKINLPGEASLTAELDRWSAPKGELHPMQAMYAVPLDGAPRAETPPAAPPEGPVEGPAKGPSEDPAEAPEKAVPDEPDMKKSRSDKDFRILSSLITLRESKVKTKDKDKKKKKEPKKS